MAFFAPDSTSAIMASQPSPSSSASDATQPQSTWEYMTNRRSRKQASIFFLGATLFTFSTLMTKRMTFARHRSTYPLFYKQSNVAAPTVDGRVEAMQALQLATMTVLSSTVMVTGGLLWAFDISSIDDLRTRIKSSRLSKGWGREDVKINENFEAWLQEQLEKRKKNDEEEKDKKR